VLRLLTASPAGTNVTVSWQSVKRKDNMGWSGWEKSSNLTTYDTDN